MAKKRKGCVCLWLTAACSRVVADAPSCFQALPNARHLPSVHPPCTDWHAVQLLPTWRAAKRTAAVCGIYVVAALLQWACDVRWDAPGAPAKQSPASLVADALLQLATIVAAVHLTEAPAFLVALFGPLAPRDLRGQAQAGFFLLNLSTNVATAEGRRKQLADSIGALFAERPHGLAGLHAALA